MKGRSGISRNESKMEDSKWNISWKEKKENKTLKSWD